jgi:hypothetical protein
MSKEAAMSAYIDEIRKVIRKGEFFVFCYDRFLDS